MPSIQSSPYPLVFKVNADLSLPEPSRKSNEEVCIRTISRSLEGMQKEAIVNDSTSGSAWRMVCDEGPWLDGTDLSSFPLGFFSAGMAATLASEIFALANRHNTKIDDLHMIQDARYSLEGSIAKRTMVGSALPIETEIMVSSDASREVIEELAYHAIAASPADAVMRRILPSCFRITNDGRGISVGKVQAANAINGNDPADIFDSAKPVEAGGFADDVIEKLEGADTSSTKKAPVIGYSDEQKRMIKVRAVLKLRDDGLKAIEVQCLKPHSGSVFNFLCDEPRMFGGEERAPTGLQYLSAGVSFCYMTQIGRYAKIVKHDLPSYRIVQDTFFSLPSASANIQTAATAEAVDTHVFLSSKEDDDAIRLMVDMAEQTCYLHASYRGESKTRLRVIE